MVLKFPVCNCIGLININHSSCILRPIREDLQKFKYGYVHPYVMYALRTRYGQVRISFTPFQKCIQITQGNVAKHNIANQVVEFQRIKNIGIIIVHKKNLRNVILKRELLKKELLKKNLPKRIINKKNRKKSIKNNYQKILAKNNC